MTKAMEQSIKEKVKSIAQKNGRTFNDVWQEVVLERWIARLSKSKYRKNFIFKGAMCLLRYVDLNRETRDLDFLIQDLSASIDEIKNYLTEVSEVDMKDGFKFEELQVGPLPHAHMKYPGYSVSVIGKLGSTKTKVFIDIGVGDAVRPTELTIKLLQTEKAPLFEKEISLWAYPVESIFAEKLETAIARADQNSRMKDYHDLLVLVRAEILNVEVLKVAIQSTFSNRETKVQKLAVFRENLPLIQGYWNHYLRSLGESNQDVLNSKIEEVIEEINTYLVMQNILDS